jgi:uncharacterized repeat protein (TIGR03806 family)
MRLHAFLALVAAGCVDAPVCMAPPGGGPLVERLSQLGLFTGPLAALQPAPGFVPYTVVAPLYSDLASKERLVYVPPGTQLGYSDDRWTLPPGAMLVKTFYFASARGRQLIETRLLVRTGDGLRAGTYLWNAAQDDAVCSGGNVDVATDSGYFHVPGTSMCQECHDQHALGMRTRQLERGDQIDRLAALGIVGDVAPAPRPALADPTGDAPVAERARSYLDANCGHCHNHDGEAAHTKLILDLESVDPGFCRHTSGVGGADRVIVPGHPEASAMLTRMRARDAMIRMPRGPTHIPDAQGLALLTEWIASLSPAGCP